MKKPFKIKGREEGRGKPWVDSFATLDAASAYIQERWQGSEYKDGNTAFHTDYSTYELVGFKFTDIGRYLPDSSGYLDFEFFTPIVKAPEPPRPPIKGNPFSITGEDSVWDLD